MSTALTARSSVSPRRRLGGRVERFFYAEEIPYGLALVRMAMPLVLLMPMLPRWFRVRELFSTDGATTPLAILYGVPDMLPEFSGNVAVALYTLFIFCLCTSALGLMTRVSMLASFVLYTYFNLIDATSTMTKYSVIASHVLLILSLSRSGDVWSLDSLLARRRQRQGTGAGPAGGPPRSAAWPRRLLQFVIAFVYFGSAITKMHTPAFFSGDQMRYWLLTNLNFSNPVGEYLSLQPSLLAFGCYAVVVWEMTFIFLCWRGTGRVLMLSIGVLFHFMTFLTLGLRVFPLVSTAIYFAFLNERDVRRLELGWLRLRRRIGWRFSQGTLSARPQFAGLPQWMRLPAGTAFALAAIVTVFCGVLVEHARDPYGERGPDGPLALNELDPDVVRPMLAASEPIRTQDKVFAFHVGTTAVGGHLVDHRRQFRTGDQLTAEVVMNPPFEDMWVECNLHDAQDRVVNRIGQVVIREMMRAHFLYDLPHALEPGAYDLVLVCAGKEVERQRISVRSGVKAVAAN